MTNKNLNLDFKIDSAKERVEYIKKNLPTTTSEIETCADYILWGKDPDGLNPVQKKEIQIKTRNGTWDTKPVESLDALAESPSFNEALIIETPLRIRRETFSREAALENAPSYLTPIFEKLFAQIDTIELTINFYELFHKKRKSEPRADLLDRFNKEDVLQIKALGEALEQFKYLKLRHEIVELRRQQYALRDFYSPCVQRHTLARVGVAQAPLSFGNEIKVFPLGFRSENPIFFKGFGNIAPKDFSEAELEKLSSFIWKKKSEEDAREEKFYFDFREIEHLQNLFLLYEFLEDGTFGVEGAKEIRELLDTMDFYLGLVELSDIQLRILELKKKKHRNQEVANIINKEFGKMYSANYISTVFRQKILGQVCDAVRTHQEILEVLFFEEDFKVCKTCGKTFLRDSRFFVRKKRLRDGLATQCKSCDREERIRKKSLEKSLEKSL